MRMDLVPITYILIHRYVNKEAKLVHECIVCGESAIVISMRVKRI